MDGRQTKLCIQNSKSCVQFLSICSITMRFMGSLQNAHLQNVSKDSGVELICCTSNWIKRTIFCLLIQLDVKVHRIDTYSKVCAHVWT